MSDGIQAGDVVKLKSDSMLMTVTKVEGVVVSVCWALDGKIEWTKLNVVAIQKVPT